MGIPVSILNRARADVSLPRSQVSDRASCSGMVDMVAFRRALRWRRAYWPMTARAASRFMPAVICGRYNSSMTYLSRAE